MDQTTEQVMDQTTEQCQSGESTESWLQDVKAMYPQVLNKTYAVPPIYFNRVPYQRRWIPGSKQSALVLLPPSSAVARETLQSTPPGVESQSTQLNVETHESQSTPLSVESQSTPISVGSQSTPLSVESQSTPLSVESQSTPLSVESQPTPLNVESQSTPISVESQSTSLIVKSHSTLLSVESQPTPTSVESQSTPISVESHFAQPNVESQSKPLNVESQESQSTSHSMESQPTPYSVKSQESQSTPHSVKSQESQSTPHSVKSQESQSTSHSVKSQESQSTPYSVKSQESQSTPHSVGPRSMWTVAQSEPESVQESDCRDDFSQQHVLSNLQALGREQNEPMFILSQLNFGDYLNQPSYAAAAVSSGLPLLSEVNKQYQRGDFDILLIHRQCGILIGELKSVGLTGSDVSQTVAKADDNVGKRVKKAIKQLEKSEIVVKHLVSDIVPDLPVRKTLFLPYVTNAQLQRVLRANPKLQQALCSSVGAASTEEAVRLCCCSDQLSHPDTFWDVTPEVMSRLTNWWRQRMTSLSSFSDELYLTMVARFVGPATTVSIHCNVPPRAQVRTVGEAVAELSRRQTRLVLTQQQLDLLNRSPPRVCVTGPPGTGKTVVLALQALKWLRQGNDVHVICQDRTSLPACLMTVNQLTSTLTGTEVTTAGQVHLRQYTFFAYKTYDKKLTTDKSHVDSAQMIQEVDFTEFTCVESEATRAVSELLAAARNDTLHVLLDEADFSYSGGLLQRLVKELRDGVPELHLWAASIYHSDLPPQLQEERMTQNLRCAPVILREVLPGVEEFTVRVYEYDNNKFPAPGDGPSVIKLYHHGNTHTGQLLECEQCGHDVAVVLRRLGVGQRHTEASRQLSNSDVIILTTNFDLKDEVADDKGVVTSAASGVIGGLRAAGIPVHVLQSYRSRDVTTWEAALRELVEARGDWVTVTHCDNVYGLERPVLVWLWDGTQQDEQFYRLEFLSRCSTQLVTVSTVQGETR